MTKLSGTGGAERRRVATGRKMHDCPVLRDHAIDEMEVTRDSPQSSRIRPVTSSTMIPRRRAAAIASRTEGSSTSLRAIVPS